MRGLSRQLASLRLLKSLRPSPGVFARNRVIEKVIAQRRQAFTRSISLDHMPILLWFPSTAASFDKSISQHYSVRARHFNVLVNHMARHGPA